MNTEEVLFNGGINNIIAPHLIGNGQAQYVSGSKIIAGELISAKDKAVDATESYGGPYAVHYKAQDETVASTEDRFYVEWAGYLYWTNSAGLLKRYDGTTVNNLGGFTAPATAPTLATSGTGLLNGTYIYAITYLHDDVFESAPSPISASVAPASAQVVLTYTDTPPASATHRLIYRSGGLNPTFNLVAKDAIANTTYTDNTSDFNISRQELTTTNNDAPPSGLDMLVEINGTLFGALGNRIYFSKAGQPEYWSNYQYVQLPTDCTGLGVSGSFVIAFTDTSMYAISGNTIASIRLTKLPFEYGCKHKRTVQSIKGNLVWLSSMDEYDVICAFTGASVEILNKTNVSINTASIGDATYADFTTETYQNFNYDTVNSAVSDRKYYLFLEARTVVVDFEDGVKTYYQKDSITGGYNKNNELYVIEGTDVYNYRAATSSGYRDIDYVTKEYADGKITMEKVYRKVHINGTGTYSIDVLVDGQKVHTVTSSHGDWTHLPSGVHGKTISFHITSTGYAKIKGISYEYERKRL